MPGLHDFGRFTIVFEQRLLLVDGQPAALGSRAFDVLRALVERRERVVGKEELMDLAWPGVIVEENNLQVQISTLRKLLGPAAIATIPGRGYQFTAAPVRTPGQDSAGGATRPLAEVGPPNAASRPDAGRAGPRGHLLVADDNKVNRLLLTRTLELLGHQVASVDNGRNALDALRAQRHDLLLLDLEMPELDGCRSSLGSLLVVGIDDEEAREHVGVQGLYRVAPAGRFSKAAASKSSSRRGLLRDGALIKPAICVTSVVCTGRSTRSLMPSDSSTTSIREPAPMPNLRRSAAGRTSCPFEDINKVVMAACRLRLQPHSTTAY
jgi:DNA-binding winged helix-turn-helix (wHTH) protein